MWPIIFYGTWLFWLIPFLAALLIIVALEEESAFVAFLGAVGGLLLVGAFTDLHPLTWALTHVQEILIAIPAYVGVGAVWGIIKWYFYCLRVADRYAEKRDDIMARYNRDKKDAEAKGEKYRTLADYVSYFYSECAPPTAKKNKNRITLWMIYWPFSAVWTLINDPVRRIFHWLYARLVTFYSRISQHVFGRFAEFNEGK